MPTQLATLTQVKEYIGNSADNTDDALLTRLITAVSEQIERSCNRVFGSTVYSEARDGNGLDFMVFSNRPVITVSSITVDGVTIPQSTNHAAAGWVLASGWKVALRGGYTFRQGIQNVSMIYTAGFASVPADVVQACCLLVGLAYKERDRMGIDSKTIGGENISFTKDDVPPSVQAVIHNYRNVFVA
jgi:hypothetical protein